MLFSNLPVSSLFHLRMEPVVEVVDATEEVCGGGFGVGGPGLLSCLGGTQLLGLCNHLISWSKTGVSVIIQRAAQ